MIVYKSYYFGLPEHLFPDLERVSQATVSQFYILGKAIWTNINGKTHVNGSRRFNDCNYSITCDKREDWHRLLLQDHAANWWAILEWQSFGSRGTIEFKFHSRTGTLPPNGYTWPDLEEAHGLSKADLHGEAICSTPDDLTWYCPFHALDFQHPLLHHLDMALKELTETP